MSQPTYLGDNLYCSISNKRLGHDEFRLIENPNGSYTPRCNCHDRVPFLARQTDAIEEREDGIYWLRRGP